MEQFGDLGRFGFAWAMMSSPDMVSLYPGSWHHIQNLDSFFTKISFVSRRGTWWGTVDQGRVGEVSSGRVHRQVYLLTNLPHLQLPPEEWFCLYPVGGCLPAGVRSQFCPLFLSLGFCFVFEPGSHAFQVRHEFPFLVPLPPKC